jgi:hypothetical protein
MTSPQSYTPSLTPGGFVASPGIQSPSTPGYGSPLPSLLSSAKQQRPPVSTRIGGSHLNPALSVVKDSTASRAGSGVGAGSVAPTSVYRQQVGAEDFDKALDDFVDRQVPELEVLLEQVLNDMWVSFGAAMVLYESLDAHGMCIACFTIVILLSTKAHHLLLPNVSRQHIYSASLN